MIATFQKGFRCRHRITARELFVAEEIRRLARIARFFVELGGFARRAGLSPELRSTSDLATSFRERRREAHLTTALVDLDRLICLARFFETPARAMAQPGELGNLARRAVVAAAHVDLLDLTGEALAGFLEIAASLVGFRGAYMVARARVDFRRFLEISRFEELRGGFERRACFQVSIRGVFVLAELFVELSGTKLLVREQKPIRSNFFVSETKAHLTGEVILPGLLITIERLVEITELVVLKPGGEPVARLLRRHGPTLRLEPLDSRAEQTLAYAADEREHAYFLIDDVDRPNDAERDRQNFDVAPREIAREPADMSKNNFYELCHGAPALKVQLFQIVTKPRAEIGPFQRIIDGGHEKAQLVAAIVASALELEAVDLGLSEHRLECFGQLDLTALIFRGGLQMIEDPGSQDVAADDGEVGRRVLHRRFLYELFDSVKPVADRLRGDDAVARDVFFRDAHHREHRSLDFFINVDHLPDTGDVARDEVVAEKHREGLVSHEGLRDRDRVA